MLGGNKDIISINVLCFDTFANSLFVAIGETAVVLLTDETLDAEDKKTSARS